MGKKENITVDTQVESSVANGMADFHRHYSKPRVIKGEVARSTGGLTATLSRSYQSIRVTTSVEIPVENSIEEMRKGQRLAVELSLAELDDVLSIFEKKLDEIVNDMKEDTY